MNAIALVVEQLTAPTADDRAAIVGLESDSFSNPWTAETFDRMLAVPVSRVYVARSVEGRIVGFCACWLIDDELHINTIAVSDTLRGRGIGSRLMSEVLVRTGVQRATLEVRRSNEAALRLYDKFGFKVTAIRHKYYENPEEDGLILWMNP
jgi:[ribosomal protein S18]-alanine N-acetyltransferase